MYLDVICWFKDAFFLRLTVLWKVNSSLKDVLNNLMKVKVIHMNH